MAASNGTPAVVCDDVSRVFSSRSSRLSRGGGEAVVALNGVSMLIESGEVVGLRGPSGSGKSTLAHLAAALELPTSGRVFIDGTDTCEISSRERARMRLNEIGIIFQRFHLIPSLTARENVALPLIEQGVSRRDRRERAEALLERVGLADRITHRPGALSGGEQQRVSVARALIIDPTVIIADEPTGELDTESGSNVIDLLTEVAEERAVLIASHDERVHNRVDRIVELLDGVRIDE